MRAMKSIGISLRVSLLASTTNLHRQASRVQRGGIDASEAHREPGAKRFSHLLPAPRPVMAATAAGPRGAKASADALLFDGVNQPLQIERAHFRRVVLRHHRGPPGAAPRRGGVVGGDRLRRGRGRHDAFHSRRRRVRRFGRWFRSNGGACWRSLLRYRRRQVRIAAPTAAAGCPRKSRLLRQPG